MQPEQAADALVHSTFRIERSYPASQSRVFSAFSDPVKKRRWFLEGEGWEVDSFTTDFRVGGQERSSFRFRGGTPTHNETIYFDIVPDQRIVFAYSITVGEQPISASLATIELSPADNGARMVYTEQGAFFEGGGTVGDREAGTRDLLEALAEELERQD